MISFTVSQPPCAELEVMWWTALRPGLGGNLRPLKNPDVDVSSGARRKFVLNVRSGIAMYPARPRSLALLDLMKRPVPIIAISPIDSSCDGHCSITPRSRCTQTASVRHPLPGDQEPSQRRHQDRHRPGPQRVPRPREDVQEILSRSETASAPSSVYPAPLPCRASPTSFDAAANPPDRTSARG